MILMLPGFRKEITFYLLLTFLSNPNPLRPHENTYLCWVFGPRLPNETHWEKFTFFWKAEKQASLLFVYLSLCFCYCVPTNIIRYRKDMWYVFITTNKNYKRIKSQWIYGIPCQVFPSCPNWSYERKAFLQESTLHLQTGEY